MAYVKMSARNIRNLQRGRGLGTVSTQVGRSLVYSSDRVPVNNLRFPSGLPVRRYPGPIIMPPNPIYPAWGENPPRWTGGPTGILTPAPVSSGDQLDPATGVSYASELAAAQAAQTTPATPTPPAASTFDVGTALSTTYASLPLYLWIALVGGGYLLLGKRGR
jgi:hypothetical protein